MSAVKENNPVDVTAESQPTISSPINRTNKVPEILSRLCKLSPEQVQSVMERARKRKEAFGKAAIALGFAKGKDVKAAVAIQFGAHFDTADQLKVPSALITVNQPYSTAAEEFRNLRTRLLTNDNGDAARLLSVVGAAEGTGSSLVAANLAVAFSQLGRKTLLIDGRLRKPRQLVLFETTSDYGLEDVVLNEEKLKDCLAPTGIRDLSLLGAPSRLADPQLVFNHRNFATLIADTCEQFDTVIVDTTTGHDVVDGRYVWALTRSVLLCARRNRSRVNELRDLVSEIKDCGAHLSGSVLIG